MASRVDRPSNIGLGQPIFKPTRPTPTYTTTRRIHGNAVLLVTSKKSDARFGSKLLASTSQCLLLRHVRRVPVQSAWRRLSGLVFQDDSARGILAIPPSTRSSAVSEYPRISDPGGTLPHCAAGDADVRLHLFASRGSKVSNCCRIPRRGFCCLYLMRRTRRK